MYLTISWYMTGKTEWEQKEKGINEFLIHSITASTRVILFCVLAFHWEKFFKNITVNHILKVFKYTSAMIHIYYWCIWRGSGRNASKWAEFTHKTECIRLHSLMKIIILPNKLYLLSFFFPVFVSLYLLLSWAHKFLTKVGFPEEKMLTLNMCHWTTYQWHHTINTSRWCTSLVACKRMPSIIWVSALNDWRSVPRMELKCHTETS